MSDKIEKPYRMRKNVNLNLLRNLITLIDGYLANYLGDPEPFKRKIRAGALGPELAKEWKRIERSLMKIATTIRRIPAFKSLVKLHTFLKVLATMFMLSGSMLVISVSFFTGEIYLYYLSMLFLTFSAISTIWYSILERRLAIKIKEYFDEHQTKYRFTRQYLRNVVQRLIFTLAYYMKANGKDPEKYPLSLYNENYNGIKIIKKPGFLRSKYKVIVKLDDEA